MKLQSMELLLRHVPEAIGNGRVDALSIRTETHPLGSRTAATILGFDSEGSGLMIAIRLPDAEAEPLRILDIAILQD